MQCDGSGRQPPVKPVAKPVTSPFDPRLPHNNPPLTRGRRAFKLAVVLGTSVAAVYLALRTDYGEKEHVFSPVRAGCVCCFERKLISDVLQLRRWVDARKKDLTGE